MIKEIRISISRNLPHPGRVPVPLAWQPPVLQLEVILVKPIKVNPFNVLNHHFHISIVGPIID